MFTLIARRRDLESRTALEKACRFQGEANYFHHMTGQSSGRTT